MTRSNPEASLQRAVAVYLQLILPDEVVWSAIGHGGGGLIRGSRLKAMGVKRGVPDIYVAYYDKEGWARTCWLELKATKGSQSLEQKTFQRRVERIGHNYHICKSLDSVVEAIRECGVPTRGKR